MDADAESSTHNLSWCDAEASSLGRPIRRIKCGARSPELTSINTDSGSQPIDRRTLSKQDAVEKHDRCPVEPFGRINETDISGMDSGVVCSDFAF